MEKKVIVYEFGNSPQSALEDWDFDALSGEDYSSPRALALYSALGADPRDYEYSLARHRYDDRLGLFGFIIEGHTFAVERAYKCALCGDSADFSAELGSDGRPVWGLRDEGGLDAGPCGDWHRWQPDD